MGSVEMVEAAYFSVQFVAVPYFQNVSQGLSHVDCCQTHGLDEHFWLNRSLGV